MNKSLPVSPAQSAWFRGERLRELRESKGLDLECLAKRLALSPAQLRQLETNQGSLFYTDAIRLATARKVSEFLGETLLLEAFPTSAEAHTTVKEAQAQAPAAQADPPARLEDAVRAREAEPLVLLRRMPARGPRIALSGWNAALCGLFMIFAVLLGLQAFAEPRVTFTDSSASETNGDASVVVSPELQGRFTAPSPAAGPAPVAGLTVQDGRLALPAAAPQMSGAGSALAPTSSTVAKAREACGASNGPTVSFTPTKSRKDPTQVFVQGLPGQVVCVEDGSGRSWRHEFSTSAGRSFSGTAPWLVESAQLAELQIYFQGNRARPSLAGATRLRLIAALPA